MGSGRHIDFARATLGLAALTLGLATFLPATSPAQTPEQAEICAEAEGRYKELFGRQTREEKLLVVLMYKYTFCPPAPAVKRGTLIRFVNVDKRTTHSVWFKDDGQLESVRLFSGEHVDIRADFAEGTHSFICGPHWEQEKMVGTLTIAP